MRFLLIGIGILLAVVATSAHHGLVMYDLRKPIALKGTIVRMDWINAHGFIYVEAPDPGGKTVTWVIETGSPGALTGQGWTKTALPVGQVVVVEGFKARDGSPKAACSKVRFTDGHTRGCGGHAPGRPSEPSRQ